MACPYFEPLVPWSEAFAEPWSGPRRVPLGEPYSGRCSRATVEIEPAGQARLCNFGYARNCCGHFPRSDDAAPDAVRFSIISGAPDEAIQLVWIAEREHAPTSHGRSEYRLGVFDPELPAAYTRLALAFVESHRKGKSPQGTAHISQGTCPAGNHP